MGFINPALYPNLAFDPLKDLVTVSPVAIAPFALFASGTLPVSNVGELITLARSRASISRRWFTTPWSVARHHRSLEPGRGSAGARCGQTIPRPARAACPRDDGYGGRSGARP